MTIDLASLISGVSGLAIVTVGYVLFIYAFSLYLKSKSYQTLALAITLLCTSSVWLGVAVNFVIYLINPSSPQYLSDLTYFALISWPIGILIPVTMFLTTSFIGEKYQKVAVSITVVIGLLWFIIVFLAIFGQVDIKTLFSVELKPNQLPDSSFTGLELLLTLFGLIVIAISGILFLITGKSSSDKVAKLRGYFLGSGYLLFSLASIFDARSEIFPSEYLLLAVRFLVILSFVLISVAILKPKRVFGS